MNVPSYLPERLTSEQLDAILHAGISLLVIAGPGSGKTEVIAWRVAHLVQAGLVALERLLVTTFTNKAALELKDRIQQKLPYVYVEAMQVGTLHAFCADLLRRYQSRSSLPRGFHILDQHGQFLFVYTRRKVLRLNTLVKGRPCAFFSDVLRLFNLAAEELLKPEGLGAWCECRSEALHGPYGYVDVIWLCAYVADVVCQQLGGEAILVENWGGEPLLLPLIHEIMDKEHDLIGDERERILWYTGCAQLVN
jgi:superfamily I DNA/RNA helicase